jgi:hypothetical protein
VRRGGIAQHARAIVAASAALSVISCARTEPRATPGTPDDLAATLRSLAGADEASRERAAATWLLDEPTWNRTVVPLYRELYAAYAAGFATACAPVVAQLAAQGTVTARLHYAGDPRLTRAQQRTRWALPTLYPSAVAELDGQPLDAVFVYDSDHWRALLGIDAIVLARLRDANPACADQLARAGPLGTCTDVGYELAASALRGDRAALARACAIAATVCANRSP